MIKQFRLIKNNRYQYSALINKYKQIDILYIDDLYKGFSNKLSFDDLDGLKLLFEIVNHRYLEKKSMIVTSEYLIKQLFEIDEGIARRFYEMAHQNIIEFNGIALNHSLQKTQ